jgi:hypothetical protein
LAWLGAACLLLIAFIPAALARWNGAGADPLSLWFSGRILPMAHAAGWVSASRDWGSSLTVDMGQAANFAAPGELMAWISGALTFAVAFFLLLSWHGRVGRRDEWEDAHV